MKTKVRDLIAALSKYGLDTEVTGEYIAFGTVTKGTVCSIRANTADDGSTTSVSLDWWPDSASNLPGIIKPEEPTNVSDSCIEVKCISGSTMITGDNKDKLKSLLEMGTLNSFIIAGGLVIEGSLIDAFTYITNYEPNRVFANLRYAVDNNVYNIFLTNADVDAGTFIYATINCDRMVSFYVNTSDATGNRVNLVLSFNLPNLVIIDLPPKLTN